MNNLKVNSKILGNEGNNHYKNGMEKIAILSTHCTLCLFYEPNGIV